MAAEAWRRLAGFDNPRLGLCIGIFVFLCLAVPWVGRIAPAASTGAVVQAQTLRAQSSHCTAEEAPAVSAESKGAPADACAGCNCTCSESPVVRLPAAPATPAVQQRVAAGTQPRWAFATFLQGDTYLAGTLTLAHSLRKHGSTLPLVLLILADLSPSPASLRLLRQAGWDVRTVQPIAPFHGVKGKRARQFRYQFTKLRLWQLTDYELVLYLDSDGFALGDMVDAFHEFQRGAQNVMTRLGTRARPALGSVVDVLKDPGSGVPGVNGGCLLVRPSHGSFKSMMAANDTVEYPVQWQEQGFLNAYFGSNTEQEAWVRLPPRFNTFMWYYHHEPKRLAGMWRDVRFVHFAGEKPRPQADRFVFSEDRESVDATYDAPRNTPQATIWGLYWDEVRVALQLPRNGTHPDE